MSTAPMGPAELADKAGQEIGVSSWIEVGQQRIDEFAHCTEDRQWIHVDVERAAKESPAGGTIAHGYLVLALLAPTGMEILVPRVRAGQILNYGLDKVRFPAPVLAGKQVRNRISSPPPRTRAAAAGCFRSRTRSRSRAATSRRWWPPRSRWCSAERRRTTHHGHQHRLRRPRPHHRRGRRQSVPPAKTAAATTAAVRHHGRGGRQARCRQDRQHRHRCRHARREEGAAPRIPPPSWPAARARPACLRSARPAILVASSPSQPQHARDQPADRLEQARRRKRGRLAAQGRHQYATAGQHAPGPLREGAGPGREGEVRAGARPQGPALRRSGVEEQRPVRAPDAVVPGDAEGAVALHRTVGIEQAREGSRALLRLVDHRRACAEQLGASAIRRRCARSSTPAATTSSRA